MRLELIRIVARAIVAERDETGQIVGEHETDPVALYTAEQVSGYYAQMRAQMDKNNEEIAAAEEAAKEAAAAATPNRASRRSSARGRKPAARRSRARK